MIDAAGKGSGTKLVTEGGVELSGVGDKTAIHNLRSTVQRG